MTKNTKKLNKYWVVTLLVIWSLSTNLPMAQAGIFDWFSGSDDRASSSQNFGFISSNFDMNTLTKKSPETAILPLIQNSSVISANSHLTHSQNVKSFSAVAREMLVPASAYSSTPDQTDDSPFITAWNTHVRDGIIAANFLPFGTKVKIPEIYGDKIFVVEDRMNRRYWHKIDIWFPDRASALNFGVKTVKIHILES